MIVYDAAFCSVFFIDKSQRVTMDDIGSVNEIERRTKEEGSEIHYLELQSQLMRLDAFIHHMVSNLIMLA